MGYDNQPAQNVSPEQIQYATLLGHGWKAGFVMMIATFAVYMTGLLEPKVPLDQLVKYWSMPSRTYLEVTGVHPGWGWTSLIGTGDYLNFIPIAFLASVTMICYLQLIPAFQKKGDGVYAKLAIAEVVILLLAASGILGSGGH
jgi:hypothetical protein